MTYQSISQVLDAVKPALTVSGETTHVTGSVSPSVLDNLAWTAAFAPTPEVKGTARWAIRCLASGAGTGVASIHDLYLAMGRGDATGFTVPAMNLRVMAYDTARAVMRAAKKLNAGAFILEIARSEIGYTEQRPHEYSAIMLAAAMREGFTGPLFVQGDHVQVNAKKFASPERDKEIATLKALIREEIEAGLLQHRHRHLDAGRARQAHAGRAAAPQLRDGGRLHLVCQVAPSRRASRSRSEAKSARSATRTPTCTNCARS